MQAGLCRPLHTAHIKREPGVNNTLFLRQMRYNFFGICHLGHPLRVNKRGYLDALEAGLYKSVEYFEF